MTTQEKINRVKQNIAEIICGEDTPITGLYIQRKTVVSIQWLIARLEEISDIMMDLAAENESLKEEIWHMISKHEDINERINHILEDPCGRDTSYYGPSKTEKSIVEICNILRDMINSEKIRAANLRPTKLPPAMRKSILEELDELNRKLLEENAQLINEIKAKLEAEELARNDQQK